MTTKTTNVSCMIVISLDCVRPEALGCYPNGFPPRVGRARKAKTPNLDRLAADGCRFDQAITQAPYTPAAHASLLTGLYPPRHAIRAIMGYKLTPDATTLAEIARAHGYQTAAFIGADTLNRYYGLHRGFDLYDDVFDHKVVSRQLGYRRFGHEITLKALDWLKGTEASRPILLFLHYFDAHSMPKDAAAALDRSPLGTFLAHLHRSMPGWAPSFYRKLAGRYHQRYFHTRRAGRSYHLKKVEEIDSHIGMLLDYLRTANLYDDALIVLTADHGDAFGEHGEIGHRHFLYDTTLKIPLIIKAGPQFAGRVVPDLVRLVDVMPTVFDLAGSTAVNPPELDGVSLVPLMLGGVSNTSAYSETCFERSAGDWHTFAYHFNSLRTSKWKLIWNRLENNVQLFDLEYDPDELVDVSNQHPEVVAAMRDELGQILERSVPCERIDTAGMPDSDLTRIKDRLRALGYL